MLQAPRKAALRTYISDRRFVIILLSLSLLLFFKFAYMQWQYGLHLLNACRWRATNSLRWCILMRVLQLQGGPHSINPIFQYIFNCFGFRPINDNFDFVFQGLNRLRMVIVALTLNGSPTKNSPTESNRNSKVANWHQNFGSLFDFQKRCAKDRLLRWLCGKWPRPVETKCCPRHHL